MRRKSLEQEHSLGQIDGRRRVPDAAKKTFWKKWRSRRGRVFGILGLQPHLVVYACKAQDTVDGGEFDGVFHAVYLV